MSRSLCRDAHRQPGFRGLVVAFDFLPFLLAVGAVDLLAGGRLDQVEQALLAIAHEGVEVVGPQQRGIDQVRSEIGATSTI